MKKQIMASVLLASMMFSVSGYADNELMSDGNDSYDKYKSPLEQSYGPIVNDQPKAESADDSEDFARIAGQLTERVVSKTDVGAVPFSSSLVLRLFFSRYSNSTLESFPLPLLSFCSRALIITSPRIQVS